MKWELIGHRWSVALGRPSLLREVYGSEFSPLLEEDPGIVIDLNPTEDPCTGHRRFEAETSFIVWSVRHGTA